MGGISGVDIILPEKINSEKGGEGTNLETRVIFHDFDDKGNLLKASQSGGAHSHYIWGYDGMYPVAKIDNLSSISTLSSYINDIHTASNVTPITVSSENALIQELNDLRDYLRNNIPASQITTYTHKPLLGVSTITDPGGVLVRYFYDHLNRLDYVEDKDGNRVSKNEYNFKN